MCGAVIARRAGVVADPVAFGQPHPGPSKTKGRPQAVLSHLYPFLSKPEWLNGKATAL